MPVKTRWFASMTQMANEPVYVDGGEIPANLKIYYHAGLDMGGAEGLVEVVAATDGLVVSSGNVRLPGHDDSPVAPRYVVVYLLDGRGWYYRYSHMQTIDPAMKPGARVKMGQKLGVLGKEGGSGGWSHLHFEVKSRQPSGKWGTQEGYAFLWQTALAGQKPEVVAVARPHHFVRVGDTVALDGSRSWCRSGKPSAFEWTFNDGMKATGPRAERTYDRPGMFSETLKVVDASGQSAYDFAVVHVVDPSQPRSAAADDPRSGLLSDLGPQAERRVDVQGAFLPCGQGRRLGDLGFRRRHRACLGPLRWQRRPARSRRLRSHDPRIREARRLPRVGLAVGPRGIHGHGAALGQG